MGGVYHATQLTLERPFALKEMLIEIPNPKVRDAAIHQFRNEAQILHDLEHPGLPRLHDFFECQGKYYLAMELVLGVTLETYVSHNEVSEAEATDWLDQLCSVLDYLHTHIPPVIFRDLKPSNIMLTMERRIKLIDFGIAKVWDDQKEGPVTRTGIRGACSPGFAAPEQYGGGTDARTDVYALGATLYSVLTRTVPPQSVDLASGRSHLTPLREARKDLSEPFYKLIDWMMSLNLRERPQNIREVMDYYVTHLHAGQEVGPEVAVVAPEQPAVAPAPTPPVRTGSSSSGLQIWKLGLVVLVALGGGWAAGRAIGHHVAEPQATPTPPPVAVTQSPSPVVAVAVVAPTATTPSAAPASASPSPAAASPVATESPAAAPLVQASLRVVPAATHLEVDGTKVAIGAAGAIKLAAGHHDLVFSHAGYAPLTIPWDLTETTPPLVVKLTPLDGTIQFTGPAGAKITIDKKPGGTVPWVSGPLKPGQKHVVKAEKIGYQSAEKGVVLKPGQHLSVAFTLEAVASETSRPIYHGYSSSHHAGASHTVHHGGGGYVRHHSGTVQIPHISMPDSGQVNVVHVPHR
jgi:serine/threonine-protein kinase